MKKSNVNIKVPKGFRLKVCKEGDRFYVNLFDGTILIGTVDIVPVRKNRYITHSDLEPRYWKRGLGALMYARAIDYILKKGWRISSSGYSSSMAQQVWKGKTLRKYFRIRCRKNKTYHSYDKWYAYPKDK